ncbi:TIGR03067 domain-containing protein [Singulisphaera acidiphila]|uniref:TIGR03067 domain-containing protein n=1 Tax=Singulisphaera acidiphila (strain ATCC BAA-1392 / DSM 18658 / VKM B-2454 / MOB10) TaxID=886293 RepID=L0D8K0_SINAD|nr:TIGR03067 domain-containing protein [Singulisphaera acidiphila]AGA24951.1 hypothetical protein Sinac_0524 [Singulisphaera acidiphila DSM 18658]
MRRYVVAILMACASLSADAPKEGASDADKAKIQGGWFTSSSQIDGGSVEVYLTEPDLIFENNELVLYGMRLGRYTLNASKTPKTMDWIIDRGYGKGTTAGIYTIKDDVLTICLAGAPGLPRPDSFTSKKGSKRQLFVYKRKL